MSKISVILPCYNVAPYIDKCLDSLLAQTLSDIEIICVDDKSTDNTVSVVGEYMARDERIKLISQPKNMGAGAARNTGRDVARGEYISFIDPDDWVDVDFYKELYQLASELGLDIAKAGMKYENVATGETHISTINQKIRNNYMFFYGEHTNAIYKLKFLNDNNIYYPTDVMTGQDAVFLSAVVLAEPKIAVTDNVFYHYFIERPGSLDSRKLGHKKVLSRIRMLDYKAEFLLNAKKPNDTDREIYLSEHMLEHFVAALHKEKEQSDDNKLLFDWLVAHRDLFGVKLLSKYYKQHQIRAIYKNDFKLFCLPEYRVHIFFKERCPKGRRNIYILGKRVYSYKKKQLKNNSIYAPNKSLNYKTYNDLAYDIKSNIQKIPDNVDLVVGIPRSGMVPAYIIGLALNRKVCSVQEFLAGSTGNSGFTRSVQDRIIKNVLVVDDTVDSGMSMQKIKEQLKPVSDKFNLCFMAVYVANEKSAEFVDVYIKQLSQPRVFQWNYMYHNITANACYDMDGVLCVDPTDEENDDGEKYLQFIKNAKPLYLPNREIGYIVTSRLEKYRKETEQWLEKHGVRYKKLYMLDCTAEERRKYRLHAKYKAKIYGQIKDSGLFIESDAEQAMEIAQLTGKRCICCTNDSMYEIKK